MRKVERAIRALKENGHRVTKVRRNILKILAQSPVPLGAASIGRALKKAASPANKTTVYRELAFLTGENLVRELRLGGKAKSYELASGHHHHHVVCVKCHYVEHVAMANELASVERRLASATGFTALDHSLEFFGYCKECKASGRRC